VIDNPFLEVVIPAYNAEKYISETLDSIFKQKTNFEFLVHISDDCSTDSTYAICEEFKAIYQNLKITKQPANIGMTRNQHFVITNSQAKYIAYLDSDDVFIPENYLQNQVDFLEKNRDVSCVFSNVEEYYEKNNLRKLKFEERNKPPFKFDLHYFFQNSIPIANSAMVFRKKFNSDIPANFVDYFQYDWLLHIHHALHGNLGFNDFIGTRYRIHDNNATNVKYAEKKFKDAIRLVYSMNKMIPTEYHKYFKHPRFEMNSLAFFYLRNRNLKNFLFWYFKWLKASPVKSVKIRDEFWLFRQALLRK
jgi:glycosyltransferase involved in cell wall biosynthesis